MIKIVTFLLKKSLRTQEKLKELKILYQNAIYTCISWYSKICWFPMKNCWCQQNARDGSRDSYMFWILFRQGIIVPSLIIVGYVWQVLGKGNLFAPPPICEQPQKSPSWIGLRCLLVNCISVGSATHMMSLKDEYYLRFLSFLAIYLCNSFVKFSFSETTPKTVSDKFWFLCE